MIEAAEAKRLITAEAFSALDLAEDRFFELINGQIIDLPLPPTDNSVVSSWICTVLNSFIVGRKLGWMTGEQGFYLLRRNPDTLRAPDAGFIPTERIQRGSRFVQGAPDLVVEVITPSDSHSALHDKIDDYFNAGARLMWLVDYQAHTVEVLTLTTRAMLHPGDTLDGGEVLTGFTVTVDTLFAPLDRDNG